MNIERNIIRSSSVQRQIVKHPIQENIIKLVLLDARINGRLE